MDVNGLPFRQLSGRADFGLAPGSRGGQIAEDLAFSEPHGEVRLARQQAAPALAEDELFARRMASTPTPVADPMGGFAWWDSEEGQIRASGFAPGAIEIEIAAPEGAVTRAPSGLALGADDVLYVARDGKVILHDLRGRWPDATAGSASFHADLIAPAPDGGAWAYDRGRGLMGRVRGRPLRFTGLTDPAPDRFQPVEPNRNPPRLQAVRSARLPATFEVVALAVSPGGRLALLGWEAGAFATLFTFEKEGFSARFRLDGLRFPYGLAWMDDDQVAVMASSGAAPAAQAYVYPLDSAPTPERALPPDGRVHPLIGPWAGGFCNGYSAPARYLTADETAAAPGGLRPLHALSGGKYARDGRVLIGPIDAGQAGCVWHRLYAEAALADRTAIDLRLWASDLADKPALPGEDGAPDWALHRLLPHPSADTPAATPVGAWLPQASEVPFAPAQLGCERRPDKAGLFTVLVQHPDRRVRRLTGRYLWIELRLAGDSQNSPRLAALRVYAHRLSWRDAYLPGFYSEALGGRDAREAGPATPNDFLERMLGSYEGALTELEGRIASAWQLTDPATAPEHALPWIASWLGVEPARAEAPERLRQHLIAAPHTARLHGTLGGLSAALELATDGRMLNGARLRDGGPAPAPGALAIASLGDLRTRALALGMEPDGGCAFLAGGSVSGGEIVIVEGFRLRRTFATILGADLADEEDPLTLGLAVSGNSFVGDTLILGDVARDELLALYRPEIDRARGDTEAVEAFYARLAWRVMVLVRGVDDPAEMKRLSECASAAAPAHVEVEVLKAGDPLIVGAASLVGVDSYLTQAPPPERVRIGRSIVGRGDLVGGRGGLDSRADGPVSPAPEAHADGPREVWRGSSFSLSALASRAAEGRRIGQHIWTWEKEA